MTDHDTPDDEAPDIPVDEPLDPVEAIVDEHLTAAIRNVRAATRRPDRHAFVARAQTRRDRLRRRRRTWTVATPIAAAVLALVAVGVIATGGHHSTTSTATRAQTAPAVDATTPIRLTPDRDLTDGQTVQVDAYAAVQATIAQCALVRSPENQRFYACTHDPADHAWNIQGHVPPGSVDDTPVARGAFTVRAHLRGRLSLLSYPDGGETDLTSEGSDVSCAADSIATVNPVPSGTGTDTTAPATSAAPRRTGPGATTPATTPCVVMVTGLFWQVRNSPLVAPITFADIGASSRLDCPTKPDEPNSEAGKPLFAFEPTFLTLCTYGVDGGLVTDNHVPGEGESSVRATLDHIQRSYVDQPSGPGRSDCGEDAITVNRIAVIATDGNRNATAWIAVTGCTTVHMITPSGPDGPP